MRVRDHRSETLGARASPSKQILDPVREPLHTDAPLKPNSSIVPEKLTSPHLPQHTRDRFSSLRTSCSTLLASQSQRHKQRCAHTLSPPSQPHIRSVHYARRRAKAGRTQALQRYMPFICNHIGWCSMALRERGWGRPHPTPQGTSSASMRKRLFRSLICSVVSFPCCAWAPSTFRGSFAPRWRFTCHQPGAGKTMHPALARLLA